MRVRVGKEGERGKGRGGEKGKLKIYIVFQDELISYDNLLTKVDFFSAGWTLWHGCL